MKLLQIVLLAFATLAVNCQHDPHWLSSRSVMVHLFEWKWADIARECETFLAPNGYAGVQVSPPFENTVIGIRPWWERYQPASFKVSTRSGNENAFVDMTRRCNAVGVRIHVDLLLNHMSATLGVGTAGSRTNPQTMDYPAVPFTSADFHTPCEINWDETEVDTIRRCQLVGLPDLDQSRENVRAKLAEAMNRLIDMGVAGFRADAMKHMWPEDLENIFGRLKTLNTAYGFAPNLKPFIVGEVIDYGGELISATEYFGLGTTTEFRFSSEISNIFRGQRPLRDLRTFGSTFHPSDRVLTFVDNHDNQRGHGGDVTLNYNDGRLYRMATAFHLAWNYGIPRIMSSFSFTDTDIGPPHDAKGNTLSPTLNADGSCGGGWVCEHRWKAIASMVEFRNTVKGTGVSNWWDNGDNQIAFSRGTRGYIAFNGQTGVELNVRRETGLPAGTYCDVISGVINTTERSCSGATFTVGIDGFVQVVIPANHPDGVIALSVDAML